MLTFPTKSHRGELSGVSLVSRVLLTGLLCFIACASATAGKFNRAIEIGQPAPKWTDLMATDGKTYSLESFKEAKVVVVVFTCNHCPVAKAYEDRILALQAKYRSAGVRVVAISVSDYEADLLPEMKKRAETKKYSFPYLHDPSQQIGKAYGAAHTPQVFVLNVDRKIAYMGRIDDSLHEDKVSQRYLADALAAVLQSKEPEVTETKPLGCEIHYLK